MREYACSSSILELMRNFWDSIDRVRRAESSTAPNDSEICNGDEVVVRGVYHDNVMVLDPDAVQAKGQSPDPQ